MTRDFSLLGVWMEGFVDPQDEISSWEGLTKGGSKLSNNREIENFI